MQMDAMESEAAQTNDEKKRCEDNVGEHDPYDDDDANYTDGTYPPKGEDGESLDARPNAVLCTPIATNHAEACYRTTWTQHMPNLQEK